MTDVAHADHPDEDEDEDGGILFRRERRLPDCGPPYPDGLIDPLTPDLLDGARYLLKWILETFWSPAAVSTWPGVWQWRKLDFLDWLRPLELLVRRMLLVEAFALALSQSLPLSARPRRKQIRVRRLVEFSPGQPQDWRVRFIALPSASGSRRRQARRPPDADRRLPGEPPVSLRYRRVLHDPWPLARRLEAVLRVILDPAPFARRMAFRLRRGDNLNVRRLLCPDRKPRAGVRRLTLATDSKAAAAQRASQLASAYWNSS